MSQPAPGCAEQRRRRQRTSSKRDVGGALAVDACGSRRRVTPAASAGTTNSEMPSVVALGAAAARRDDQLPAWRAVHHHALGAVEAPAVAVRGQRVVAMSTQVVARLRLAERAGQLQFAAGDLFEQRRRAPPPSLQELARPARSRNTARPPGRGPAPASPRTCRPRRRRSRPALPAPAARSCPARPAWPRPRPRRRPSELHDLRARARSCSPCAIQRLQRVGELQLFFREIEIHALSPHRPRIIWAMMFRLDFVRAAVDRGLAEVEVVAAQRRGVVVADDAVLVLAFEIAPDRTAAPYGPAASIISSVSAAGSRCRDLQHEASGPGRALAVLGREHAQHRHLQRHHLDLERGDLGGEQRVVAAAACRSSCSRGDALQALPARAWSGRRAAMLVRSWPSRYLA